MSALPGTTCLLTESEDDLPPSRPARAPRCQDHVHRSAADPGPSADRATLAAQVGRPVTLCHVCGIPTGELFTRRSRSGKTFCQPCADQVVAAYCVRHPEARPATGRPPRERTGISHLEDRERYEVRYHAGNGRWQIADIHTRRWTSRYAPTEAGARALAAAMDTAWRTQVESEKVRFSTRVDVRAQGL